MFSLNKPAVIYLALSILGIFLLLVLSKNLPPQQKTISQITSQDLNHQIQLNVKITRVTDFLKKGMNFQILNLQDATGNITAITSSNIKLEINKSITYIIIGKVQEYNRTLQINVDKILLA